MNSNYYKKYEPIFNSWHIKELLGEGSFGKVYLIERQDFGVTYKAALKAITIPQSQSEVKSVMADGMDEASATSYFRQVVEELVGEFVLMSKLKGNSNVVSYEDHIVMEHENGIGWDILIRMELLIPLIDHVRTTKLTRKDIITLGIDMCKALELCQKYNIIHRDIKPENIFISENGDYKLGDFGIARTVEKTTGGLSKKGTYVYMAPEIYKGEAYGSNIDLYSLGIVMYRLLNENRTPFLPAYPAPITHNDRESAVMKRISGSVMPKPVNAEGRLAEIVMKACAYKSKDRYSSPMQMREELEAILYNKEEAKIIYPKGDDAPIKSIEYVETGAEAPVIDKADKTDLLIEVSQEDDSTDGKTEGVFKNSTIHKTESAFGEKYEDLTVNKTESVLGDNVFTAKVGKKKRFLPLIITAVILLLSSYLWWALTPEIVPVGSITIDLIGVEDTIELYVDEKFQITPIADADEKAIAVSTLKLVDYVTEEPVFEYEIADLSIALINDNKEVVALSAGTTELRVFSGEFEKRVVISVSEPHQVVEEWRVEGYEAADPYREYERLYRDDVPTDEIRYTGNHEPQEQRQTNQSTPTTNTRPSTGSSGGNSSGTSNRPATPRPTQAPTPEPAVPKQDTPALPPRDPDNKPPDIYVDFD